MWLSRPSAEFKTTGILRSIFSCDSGFFPPEISIKQSIWKRTLYRWRYICMKFHTWDEHQHGGRLICVNVWRQLQTENCEEFILETGMKCSCGKIFQPAYRDLGFSDRDLGKPGHPLVWTHRKFYKGFKGKARSWKPGQHGQPGSYEEALRLWMKFYFIHCNRRLL